MTKINTISQALRRIKELKGKVAQLDRRMQESVCWSEPGAKPVYNFAGLAEEREIVVAELVTLKGRLAKTNSTTTLVVLDRKLSVQTAVFLLAELKGRKDMIASLSIREGEFKESTHAYDERGRAVFETKRMVTALGLLARDEQVASLEKSIAEINEVIEDTNHRTALVE